MVTYNPVTEKDFQKIIIDYLVAEEGYIERVPSAHFNADFALDQAQLLGFLERSQTEQFTQLRQLYKDKADSTIIRTINQKIARDGLIKAIWDGVTFEAGISLDLVSPRPSANFDPTAQRLFEINQLSIMQEVYHTEGERLDLVIFLNGLPLFTVELKCNTSASGDYRNAINQYKEERDSTTRLLSPKIGALSHFAMDLNEVYVCASLQGKESFFLPFNQGQPDGENPHNVKAGNPHNPGGINTSYMWQTIWTKDAIFDLLYDFIYLETIRDPQTHKVTGERPIFPRYQQLRAVTRLACDVQEMPIMRNYLIEHSAGSGKTKTIAWLAHKLASLYKPGTDELMYDKVIIATDRKVVDKQLQDAVKDMAKEPAVVRVMNKNKTSSDLAKALGLDSTKRRSSYRIVATTIQKFLYLDQGLLADTNKRFAIIIDEAHGSTSGKNMNAMNAALASSNALDSALDDVAAFISQDISNSSRQKNISIFGFTATPTGRTLQNFGIVNEKGEYEAFDLYSMRQAIEEGFILDVTANYTTYNQYCKVVKAIENDPELESTATKRKLAYLISTSPENINAKLEIITEHFMSVVAPTLQGKAKSMIVTAGREQAVRYFLAYHKLRSENMDKLGKIRALVAFTGDIEIDGHTYTESELNQFSEDHTTDYFDTDDYRILIVAEKFQTGFDQPKLCAMYVDKALRGVSTVQTLSRLNRIMYDKRTFVLDFANSFESIQKDFAPYYENTVLADPLTPTDVRETHRRLLSLEILDIDDVEEFNEILAKPQQTTADTSRLYSLLDSSVRQITSLSEEEGDEARRTIRNFIKQYSFLLQVAPFEDRAMHMDFNFCSSLIRAIDSGKNSGINFDLTDKVTIEEFKVTKNSEHSTQRLVADPEVKIAKGTGSGLSQTMLEKLSKIINDWNSRFGTKFSADIAAGPITTLQYNLENDPKIIQSAKVNSKSGFKHTVEDRMQYALVKGYNDNTEVHKFLLSNQDATKELVEALVSEIYAKMR